MATCPRGHMRSEECAILFNTRTVNVDRGSPFRVDPIPNENTFKGKREVSSRHVLFRAPENNPGIKRHQRRRTYTGIIPRQRT